MGSYDLARPRSVLAARDPGYAGRRLPGVPNMMLADQLQAPPPGALEWIKGVIAGAAPVLLILWRWWEKVRRKLDKAADEAAESARQFQALHRNLEKLAKELAAQRERLVVLEDRSDRGERERTVTRPEGYPIEPHRPHREPTRSMSTRVAQPRRPPVQPESSPPGESSPGGVPVYVDDKKEGSE